MPLDLLEIPGPRRAGLVPSWQNLGDLAVSYDGKGALPSVGGSRQGSVATAKPQRLPIAACELAPAALGETSVSGFGTEGTRPFQCALVADTKCKKYGQQRH
jgi:hypothetical protein